MRKELLSLPASVQIDPGFLVRGETWEPLRQQGDC